MVGDGLLCCPDAAGKFRHPVLLQKLELEFYLKKQPQFVFLQTQQPELYMEFLRVLPEVNTQQLARCADELKKTEFAPLGEDDTDGFLLRLIQGLFPKAVVQCVKALTNLISKHKRVAEWRITCSGSLVQAGTPVEQEITQG